MVWYEKLIEDYIPKDKKLDLNKLPEWQREIVLAIADESDSTPYITILHSINFKMAVFLQMERLKLNHSFESKMIPINYYGLTFMGSGKGKDRVFRTIDQKYLKDVINDFNKRKEQYRIDEKERIEIDARSKFETKAAQDRHIKDNQPRPMELEFKDSTAEGLASYAKAYQDAGFGSTNLMVSEMGNYITTSTDARKEFISMIVEMYDFGDSKTKLTKGDRASYNIEGVPVNLFGHTSPEGLFETPQIDKVKDFFKRGMCRRSFICFPDADEFRPMENFSSAFDKIQSIKNKSNRNKDTQEKYSKRFLDVYHRIKTSTNIIEDIMNNRYVSVTDKAYEVYYAYEEHCLRLGKELSNKHDEGYLSEIETRSWKCFRLAAIIAAIDEPETLAMSAEHILQAIYQTELFGLHFAKFYFTKEHSFADRIFAYLKKHVGQYVLKTEIRTHVAVRKEQEFFPDMFLKNLPYVIETAEKEGFVLIVENEKNSTRLMLEKTNEIDFDNITISTGPDNVNFSTRSIKWTDLGNLIASGVNYSPCTFKDGYRNQKNYLTTNHLIILDIDDTWTMEYAAKKMKNFKCMITTTRNHQKEKRDKPVCDRFRIIFPTPTEFKVSSDRYKQIMKNIGYFFKDVPDSSCHESARFFYGNKDAQTIYIDGQKLLDWRDFDLGDTKAIDSIKKMDIAFRIAINNPLILRIKGTLKDYLGTERMEEITELHEWGNDTEGRRHTTLVRIAFWFRDDDSMSNIEAVEELRRINDMMTEPVDEEEINGIIKSIFK